MLLLPRAPAAVFMVEHTGDEGVGSLRQAIVSANTLLGPDEIHFNIPASGPQTIVPFTELPPLVDPVTIDGTTQPGYAGTPLIRLDGGLATVNQGGFVGGFRLVGGNSTVRGLSIYSFGSFIVSGAAIWIFGSGTNVIEANHIGYHPDLNFAGNTVGVLLNAASDNRIGGARPEDRNVISHNFVGVEIANTLVTISSNNLVQGNFIGIDPTGTIEKPNLNEGVLIGGGKLNRVVGNRIAFNFENGVRVSPPSESGNTISQNAIYSNRGLGINLQPAGETNGAVTPNDALDTDFGPNGLQNFPVLTDISAADASTRISGHLPSTADRQFRIEFYRSVSIDSTGFGEGEVYLGSTSALSGVDGVAVFSFSISSTFPNEYVTATATDLETGDTSEFSQAIQAPPEPPTLSIVVAAGEAQLQFASVPGQSYRVEKTAALDPPAAWTVLPGAEALAGTGGILTVREPLSSVAENRFYRVRVLR